MLFRISNCLPLATWLTAYILYNKINVYFNQKMHRVRAYAKNFAKLILKFESVIDLLHSHNFFTQTSDLQTKNIYTKSFVRFVICSLFCAVFETAAALFKYL